MFLVRHSEMEVPTDAPKGSAASVLDSLNWGVTKDKGHAQSVALGNILNELALPADTVCIAGTGRRFRETASVMTESFGADLRWYTEEYLNARPRGLIKNPEVSHRALYEKNDMVDESIAQFIARGPERLQRRIKERLGNIDALIVVSTGELIKGFLGRIEGWAPIKIVQSFLAKNGENDLKEGEMFEISSRSPETGDSIGSFRYKRKISPLADQPMGDWKYFEVPRYSSKELLDPKIWGER